MEPMSEARNERTNVVRDRLVSHLVGTREEWLKTSLRIARVSDFWVTRSGRRKNQEVQELPNYTMEIAQDNF